MAITALEYINARYPAVDAVRAGVLVPIAETELSSARYGDLYGNAIGLLVLHWITKDEMANGGDATGDNNSGTSTGNITGEKEGDLSRNYGDNNPIDNGGQSGIGGEFSDWATTAWGRELIRLTKATCFGAGVA